MKRLYCSTVLANVHVLKHELEQAGIASQVRNTHLSALSGALPFTDVMPELWVADDVHDEALKVMARREADALHAQQLDPWKCPGCSEMNEPQFGQCWQCGTEVPDTYRG